MSTDMYSQMEQASMGAALTGIYVVSLIIGILSIVAMWRIFAKAGEPGWAAIIPLYNAYVLYKISWGNGWLFLLQLVPCVNVVFAIMLCFKLSRAFGKGTGFGFGLLFLNVIFMMILGFGDAKYIGVQG